MSFSPLSSSSGRPATLTPSYCAKSAGTAALTRQRDTGAGRGDLGPGVERGAVLAQDGCRAAPVSSQRASFSGFSGAESEEVGSVE